MNFLNQIDLLINKNYFFALSIYFIFSLFFYLFSMPGTPIIVATSSFFFGVYLGFLVNLISVVIGSFLFFLISKFFFKKLFSSYLSKYVEKLEKIIKKSSLEYLILLRLIFEIPLLIQNIFLSSLNISKTKFIISSILGFTPYFFIFSYFGSKFSSIMDVKNIELNKIFTADIIIFFLILILIILFKILYNNFKSK